MKDSVAKFCLRYKVRLPKHRADDFYSIHGRMQHCFMSIGVVDEIITDGIEAWVWSKIENKVLNVHFSNLTYVETPRPYKTAKTKTHEATNKPGRKRTRTVYVEEPDWAARLRSLME